MSKFNSSTADTCALLNTYMYLDVQDEELDNQSLIYSLDYIKRSYPNKATTEEFKILQKACDENPSLGNMKIVSQSHYDHIGSNGESFFNYSGDSCTDDPIQACAFKDENGNLYVAYRGTGNRRWGDNGQGFVDSSTDMQYSAKEYLDHVADECGYNELYTTGHSKGGNEAQYSTITSKHKNDITACYSFDGQGFSDDAIAEFENNPNYKEILKKMYSIDGDNDPIHKLIGVIIPKENTYYVNTHYKDSNGNIKISYFHNILGIVNENGVDWKKDKYGNITNGSEGWLSKFGELLNFNLQTLPKELKGSCAIAVMELIDMIKGGSMDDAEAGFFDFVALDFIGKPLILASLTEFAVVSMYEKYGFIGAIATIIIAVGQIGTWLPIVDSLVGVLEVGYIIKKIVDKASEIIERTKELIKNAGAWVDKFLSSVVSYINNISEWLFKNSSGYQYASANPNIFIDTTTMKQYAGQLRSLSSRSKKLDSKMNSLYWNLGISWNTISNLGKLLKSEVILDFAYRLDKCAKYLEDTVDDFDKVERSLIGNA